MSEGYQLAQEIIAELLTRTDEIMALADGLSDVERRMCIGKAEPFDAREARDALRAAVEKLERESEDRLDAVTKAAIAIGLLTERAERAERAEVECAELRELLKDAKRGHYYCEDSWYSCPKAEDGCADESQGTECNCGAEEWNARIDAALAKEQKHD